MRERTITDDVIEAMQRGIDEKSIREMGLIHDELVGAKIEDPAGYWDADIVMKVGKKLGLPYSGKDAHYDHEYIDQCFLEIRYRLTGHRNEMIED